MDHNEQVPVAGKRTYRQPKLKEWGSIVELTQVGRSAPAQDFKMGSRPARGR
jgi:hypothetical protein